MTVQTDKNTLSNISVKQAMRRQVISLPQSTSINSSINTLIKNKISAILATDEEGNPSGVLSKTDIVGAYYAELSIDSPLEFIMAGPPLFCNVDDSLETALENMRNHSVYRLYVTDNDGVVTGTLAYPDIVGLLYRSCHDCEFSHFNKNSAAGNDTIKRLRVKDITVSSINFLQTDSLLSEVIEELSSYRLGALLLTTQDGEPAGVISKTDLILAYKHDVDMQMQASSIMTGPVEMCYGDDLLEDAVKKMIFSDIHRLFVKNKNTETIEGVFSLTDAARCRSGSCHACISSRITLED